jgi:CRP/FNR family transcriptional regulator, cyclic AMP receptor protein
MSLKNLRTVRHAKSDIADNIEYLPWLQDLVYQDIFAISGYFKAYKLIPNQHLFEEGSIDAYMVIVIKGKINIVKETSGTEPQVITVMRSGKVFGELSLLDGGPRSASAIAQTDAVIYGLSEENFSKMQDENPRLALILVSKISRIISQRLRQTTGLWVELLDSIEEKK